MMDPSKGVKFSEEVTIVFEPASPPTSLTSSTFPTASDGGHDTSISRSASASCDSHGSAVPCLAVGAPDEATESAVVGTRPQTIGDETAHGTRPEDPCTQTAIPTGSIRPITMLAENAKPPPIHEGHTDAKPAPSDLSASITPPSVMSHMSTVTAPGPIPGSAKPTTAMAAGLPERQMAPNLLTQTISGSAGELSGQARTHSVLAEYLLEGETIEQARLRLRTAIQQTKSLCKSFTDRVYSKYRVCLQPVQEYPETLHMLQTDPRSYLARVATEMQLLKEEKELEKKEANKLQAEVSAAPALTETLDLATAEQLLYVTAGLNLIILPEADIDAVSAARYPERGPFSRGERVRGISQAAAMAGELMLDRARKAAALRLERQKRFNLAIASGAPQGSPFDALQHAKTVAAAAIAAAAHSSIHLNSVPGANHPPRFTRVPGAAKVLPAKAGKRTGLGPLASRTQAQSALATAASLLSTSTLLSVSPLADQISNSPNLKPAAATSALMARSCIQKTTQQRLKHPFPDSMGGRRRANSSKKDEFLQSHLALTLPPLPSTRERLERKALPLCNNPTERGLVAVRGILRLFNGKSLTKIGLMHGIRQLSEAALSAPDSSFEVSDPHAAATRFTPPIDPGLTFSVLHAVGLVRATDASTPDRHSWKDEIFSLSASPIVPDTLRALRSHMGKSTLTGRMFEDNNDISRGVVEIGLNSKARGVPSRCQVVEAESIRGGGDSSDNSSAEEVSESGEGEANATATLLDSAGNASSPAGTDTKAPLAGKRKYSVSSVAVGPQSRRKYSDPGTNTKDSPVATESSQSSQVAAMGQLSGVYGQAAALNAYHLASQLRSMQHPAGELADFIGNLHARTSGYDLSSFLQASAPGSLSGLTLVQPAGGLLGFDGSRMFARDQQAAAPSFPQTAAFPHGGSYPAAVNPLLASSPPMMSSHGPFTLGGSQILASRPSQSEAKPGAAHQAGEQNRTQATSETLLTSQSSHVVSPKVLSSTPQAQGSSLADDEHASQQGPNVSADATNTEASTDQTHENQPIQTIERPIPGAKSAEAAVSSTTSDLITSTTSDLIIRGKFHSAVLDLPDESRLRALSILGSTAANVPVPKALVSSPLKDKLANSGLKTLSVPRDVIVSVILVWLWANNGKEFQEAFEKSGRYDVDHGCNWLVHTVVDTAVFALSLDARETLSQSGKGPFADVGAARKIGPKHPGTPGIERDADAAKMLEVRVASVVSKALCAEVQVDEAMDQAIAEYQRLLDYLDEARLCALRAKAQERALLASLISRSAMMAEPFANAYVSSVVRAGEALGHENLFEAVQDVDLNTSSLMPYDILTAEGDLWEEPCKPEQSFTSGMTGDDMTRRAHARAMLQKSLRKLQERHQIRGGIPYHGPYAELLGRSTPGASTSQPAASPRAGYKRKSTFGETLPSGGTGSARAKTWSVYEPSHHSAPLEWQADHSENMPYGLHRVGERVRSLSLSLSARSGEPRSIKKARRSSSFSGTAVPVETVKPEDGFPKSTQEINWGDIAGIFQSVELPKKTPPSKAGDKNQQGESAKSRGEAGASRTIYAPYCGVIDLEQLQDDESTSEDEEDLSEEAVLARHQVVLDAMKARHAAILEARRKLQEERRKSKSNK